VIGSNGLIGSSLVQLLSTYYRDQISVSGISQEDFDLSRASSQLRLDEVLTSLKPTAVIVLAASKRQFGDSQDLLHHNNAITDNILPVISRHKTHIIYLSSCAIYGEKNYQMLITEDSQSSPTSFYGEHKKYSENSYAHYIDPSKLLILRPPLIYGHKSLGYNPAGFIFNAINTHELTLWGNGEELREFIHVHDASSFIINAITSHLAGTLNLVSGRSYSYRQMSSLIESLLPLRVTEKPRSLPLVDHTYRQHPLVENILPTAAFISPLSFIHSEVVRLKLNYEGV